MFVARLICWLIRRFNAWFDARYCPKVSVPTAIHLRIHS